MRDFLRKILTEMSDLPPEIKEIISEYLPLKDATSLSLTCWSFRNIDRRMLVLDLLKNKESLELPLTIIVDTFCSILKKFISDKHRDEIEKKRVSLGRSLCNYYEEERRHGIGYFRIYHKGIRNIGIIGPTGQIGDFGSTGYVGIYSPIDVSDSLFHNFTGKREHNLQQRYNYKNYILEYISQDTSQNRELFLSILVRNKEIALYLALKLKEKLPYAVEFNDPLIFYLTSPRFSHIAWVLMKGHPPSKEIRREHLIIDDIIKYDADNIFRSLDNSDISEYWIREIVKARAQKILKELSKTPEIRALINSC